MSGISRIVLRPWQSGGRVLVFVIDHGFGDAVGRETFDVAVGEGAVHRFVRVAKAGGTLIVFLVGIVAGRLCGIAAIDKIVDIVPAGPSGPRNPTA